MAYPAIETKFIGATDYRGARIKATVTSTNPGTGRKESVTIPFPYELSGSEGDRLVAWKLIRKCGFRVSELVEGATDRGSMFVLLPDYS